jgi:hypothetical protein
MSAAAYKHLARQLEDADLFRTADLCARRSKRPASSSSRDSIAEHRQKMLAQLLNETTRPEEITRLRGLIAGLDSMEQAAQSILEFAMEREARANERLRQESIA